MTFAGAELKWLSEPVSSHTGSFDQIGKQLPNFERRPLTSPVDPLFAWESSGLHAPPSHRYLDLIVRPSMDSKNAEIPVGVVSKRYGLIQHRDVLEAAMQALKAAGENLKPAEIVLRLTESKGRMALSFVFPKEFNLDPGDGHPLALRLECLNSVDGSSRLRMALGWYRFVCSNGLMLGESRLNLSLVHNGKIHIDTLKDRVRSAMQAAKRERELLKAWNRQGVQPDRLIRFVDGRLRAKWGVRAAARAFLICREGYDGKAADPFLKANPSAAPMIRTLPVPGSKAPADNIYAVVQALAWIANQRRDLKDQIQMTEQIPDLILPLTKS